MKHFKIAKLIYPMIALCCLCCAITSCTPEEEDPVSFDQTLLYGKWQSGTLFEVYESDGNGHTWDTGDDVDELEAQPFTWTLTEDNLVQIHIMTNGTNVPKSYTVTKLTASTLSYHDDYNKSYTFSKVN
ncbi:MAG: hypothetical protein LBR06_06095 [Bacteroidales bacterium]|jgi:hypothetical protein|nr:hypothetical protein [Bacteroidales bacterium]